MGAEAADVAPAPVPRVSIRENDDGTYAITAVQHVRKKKPSWITGRTLTATRAAREWCHAASGAAPDCRSHRRQREYQVLARWDTPKVVKGVSFCSV